MIDVGSCANIITKTALDHMSTHTTWIELIRLPNILPNIVRSNVLNVGRQFEISAEMSGNSCDRYEIDYPISNFPMGLMSPKFRQISEISADFAVQISAEIDISFCFIFSFGFESINPTRPCFIREEKTLGLVRSLNFIARERERNEEAREIRARLISDKASMTSDSLQWVSMSPDEHHQPWRSPAQLRRALMRSR